MSDASKGKYFAYAHNERVVIMASGETGTIISRMDSAEAADMYQLRYKDANGCAVERWWSETALCGAH